MPRRRPSIAPQTEIEVLNRRIESLENQVKALRQPGPSYFQADDYEDETDPVPWQAMINHPGAHVEASPNDPLVYYHPGDDTVGGTVPAGFKKVGADATTWASVNDPFYGQNIDSSMGIKNCLFSHKRLAENAGGVFSIDQVADVELGSLWNYTIRIHVGGIYSLLYFAKSQNAADFTVGSLRFYIDTPDYPGRAFTLWLSKHWFRDTSPYTNQDERLLAEWTIPLEDPGTGGYAIVPKIQLVQPNPPGTQIEDFLTQHFIMVYHGPLNFSGNLAMSISESE